MGSWKRTGWVVEQHDRDTTVDYVCAGCGTRIGVLERQTKDSDLLKKILKSASCKCKR